MPPQSEPRPIDIDIVVTKCACNDHAQCLWHYGVDKIMLRRKAKGSND